MNTTTPMGMLQQPRPFFMIFFVELWERVGYYGVQGVLAVFFVKQLGFSQEQAFVCFGAFAALVAVVARARPAARLGVREHPRRAGHGEAGQVGGARRSVVPAVCGGVLGLAPWGEVVLRFIGVVDVVVVDGKSWC